LPALYRNSSWY